MATRLSIKKRKRHRDRLTAYKAGKNPKRHKVSEERSKKAKKKMYNRA